MAPESGAPKLDLRKLNAVASVSDPILSQSKAIVAKLFQLGWPKPDQLKLDGRELDLKISRLEKRLGSRQDSISATVLA